MQKYSLKKKKITPPLSPTWEGITSAKKLSFRCYSNAGIYEKHAIDFVKRKIYIFSFFFAPLSCFYQINSVELITFTLLAVRTNSSRIGQGYKWMSWEILVTILNFAEYFNINITTLVEVDINKCNKQLFNKKEV